MRLLGFEITRLRKQVPANLQAINERTWWPLIREPFAGAWQRNQELRRETILTYSAVYACVTLIASDVAKMRLRLVEQDRNGIWNEVVANSPFWPVLRRPNRFQNRIKFIEHWIVSKLLTGNTYALKQRDERGVVSALYILDPTRVKVLVAPEGEVFYQLSKDNLAGVEDITATIPAREIIHDVMVPLYHPLCGVSPISACGVAAGQGLAIQQNSTKFFDNGAQPGGILTSPHHIPDTTAQRLKDEWANRYSGVNAGKTAVLGDGLEYKPITVNASDSQLIEQLKWTAETVCSCFHVPPYMIGVGPAPTYNNIEALNAQYYAQCLQGLIESIELCLDEGLGLTEVSGKTYGTEFDLDDLLRMDSKTLAETEKNLSGIKTPNESRKRLNLPPIDGGDTVYRQEQEHGLPALAKRDQSPDPFKSGSSTPKPPAAANDDQEISDEEAEAMKVATVMATKSAFARLSA